MRASGATSASRSAAVASRRSRIASIVSSRWSERGRSAMATHALAEALERPQLKLLDRAFRPMEGRSHLANALLLHEAHPDDLTLQVRQSIDLSIQRQPTFDVRGLAGIGDIRWYVLRLWTA